jgi:hypothetical protein
MKLPTSAQGFEKKDYLVALALTALALAAYVRTLAPDVLYSDSAEFQTLAYTFGITHSTGYPIYLLLARLFGFLPFGNPAWRISLFSAFCAALTVGGVYLLARDFTRNRLGPALGAVALGISYSFWSQAVIAEVYTPGLAFLTGIMLLLFHWQADPARRNRSLLAAALLAGIGFGVHASVWLIAPPAAAFVIWTLAWQRAASVEWLKTLSAGFAGALIGLALFLAAFFISDRLNSPTSFINTSLEPSRVFWKIPAEAFASPLGRLKMTVVSAQWGHALFPKKDFSFTKSLENFGERLALREFSPLLAAFALFGFGVMLVRRPLRGTFYPLAFLFSATLILNYKVGDINVFYLSLYLPLSVASGVGMGSVLDWVRRRLTTAPGIGSQILFLLLVLFLVTVVIQPFWAARWEALRSGVAGFITDDYPFPVKNLGEPRVIAQTRLAGRPNNAVYVLDWRALFSTAYVAHVEKRMTNTLFFEAMPFGNDGRVATTLVSELTDCLKAGRPVYADQKYPGLEIFRLVPTANQLYELKLRE